LSTNPINKSKRILFLGLAAILLAGFFYTVYSEEEEDIDYLMEEAAMLESDIVEIPLDEFEKTKATVLEHVKTYNTEVKVAALDEKYTLLLAMPSQTSSKKAYAQQLCGLYKDFGVKQIKIVDMKSVAMAKNVSDWKVTAQCACE